MTVWVICTFRNPSAYDPATHLAGRERLLGPLWYTWKARPMNPQLFTHEPTGSGARNHNNIRLKFTTAWQIPNHSRGISGILPRSNKDTTERPVGLGDTTRVRDDGPLHTVAVQVKRPCGINTGATLKTSVLSILRPAEIPAMYFRRIT